jgi:GntR family transcriptional regulator
MTDERDSVEATPAGERGMGYREISQTLIADIRAGTWAIGDQLPTEAELVDRFGASRNTVRESLRELDLYGYIRRRRGTRSILVAREPLSFVNSARSIEELLQYSRHTRSRLLNTNVVIASPQLAEELEAQPGSDWLCIEMLRTSLRGDAPVGYSEIYVAGRYADIADDLSDDHTVYALLEKSHGLVFARVEQSIEAAIASRNVASRLGVEVGSSILRVRTVFVASTGEIVEIGFGHFPAGRYKMEIMLERAGKGRLDE